MRHRILETSVRTAGNRPDLLPNRSICHLEPVFYYVLPGAGMFGGVKKGFHCADLLTEAGYPCEVALPEVEAPGWFPTDARLLSHEDLAERCRADDTLLFSCPSDAPFVDSLPAGRKVLHMQGASTPADLELFDSKRGYELISHGLHMTYEVQRHGRVATAVPMGVPDVFRWKGASKRPGSVLVLSRKNGEVLPLIREALPATAELVVADGLSEADVAARMKETDIFLAISPHEALGLPPLEAMCAGCCVVGFPGIGGFEFMRHGDTAHVVPNEDVGALAEAIQFVFARPSYRDELREAGRRISATYTMERERAFLLKALGLRAGASAGAS